MCRYLLFLLDFGSRKSSTQGNHHSDFLFADFLGRESRRAADDSHMERTINQGSINHWKARGNEGRILSLINCRCVKLGGQGGQDKVNAVSDSSETGAGRRDHVTGGSGQHVIQNLIAVRRKPPRG
ncbi:unnamed protein product, partial [Nesidiocoris tenuis]